MKAELLKTITSSPSGLLTVNGLLRLYAEKSGEKIALRFEGRETSYAELDRLASRAAAALTAQGVAPGDRVAYIGRNSDQFFILLYAAARIGAVTAPIGWRLALPEVQHILEDISPKLLLADADWRDKACAMSGETPLLLSTDSKGQQQSFLDFINGYDGDANDHADDPDAVIVQLYTSGTTGKPKGVMLTSRNFLAKRIRCAEHGLDWDQWAEDDIALVAMPISHVGGFGLALMTLFHGATAHIAPEFIPDDLLRHIEEDGATKLFLVPTAIQMMARHPRAREIDFSHIKHFIYGAAPMPLPVLLEASEVFGVGMVQVYGMTEAAAEVLVLEAEDHDPDRPDKLKSAGKPLPGVEIKVTGPDGSALPSGEIGEILIRSDSTMKGYWRQDEATSHAIDADNWLHSGDAGYIDAEGFVFICDRIKDMIISGGENVYPIEVESILAAHPDVASVAVIGVPDDIWGEAVKAVVVAQPGAHPEPSEIIDWARSHLAGYKLPKSIDLVEALPMTPTGKLDKKVLREPYWKGRERNVN